MRLTRCLTRAAALIGMLQLLVCAAPGSTARAAAPAPCDMRLRVVLTPDVPEPGDAGLLDSLLSHHPGYQLTLQREDFDNASVIVVDLTGPGPEVSCRQVVEALRADPRVWSVDEQQDPTSTAEPAPDGQLFVYPKDGRTKPRVPAP